LGLKFEEKVEQRGFETGAGCASLYGAAALTAFNAIYSIFFLSPNIS